MRVLLALALALCLFAVAYAEDATPPPPTFHATTPPTEADWAALREYARAQAAKRTDPVNKVFNIRDWPYYATTDTSYELYYVHGSDGMTPCMSQIFQHTQHRFSTICYAGGAWINLDPYPMDYQTSDNSRWTAVPAPTGFTHTNVATSASHWSLNIIYRFRQGFEVTYWDAINPTLMAPSTYP